MRVRATTLIVAGVAVLAVAATIDALRRVGADDAPAREPAATATLPISTEPNTGDLAREGVSGVLYLTVRTGAECEFRAYALPRLTVTATGDLRTCRFQIAPDARHIAEQPECPTEGGIITSLVVPEMAWIYPGCGAAWRPDGKFTYVARGGVVEAQRLNCLGAAGCARVVIPRSAVLRGVRRLHSGLGASSVTQIEWLTQSRLAVVVRLGSNRESIVLFEGRRPVQTVDLNLAPHPHLEIDAGQKQILVGGRGQNGFFALNFQGGFIDANSVPFFDAAAVALSPEGRFLALARPGNVCVYLRRGEYTLGCIPDDAQDLAWR